MMGRSDWNFMVVVDVETRRGCCTRKRRDFARAIGLPHKLPYLVCLQVPSSSN